MLYLQGFVNVSKYRLKDVLAAASSFSVEFRAKRTHTMLFVVTVDIDFNPEYKSGDLTEPPSLSSILYLENYIKQPKNLCSRSNYFLGNYI